MPALDWTVFDSLPGSKSQNFENLCRGLIRLHYGRYGNFRALSNNPGVEFHIELAIPCSLGSPPRWFGWQCKLHTRTQNGNLRSASKRDIEESLRTSEKIYPKMTDWVLWTPYTLSTSDQKWFDSLSTSMTLHLWNQEDLDTYLSVDGLILRSTYFGELILTPEHLRRCHSEAIQPIRERWLEPVHQSVDAERTVRRMLGEPSSWNQMISVGGRLKKAADIISNNKSIVPARLEKTVELFAEVSSAFADTLLNFHEILAGGDLDVIQQKLKEYKTLIDTQVNATPRWLRACNSPISLDATNALNDMRIAQDLLDEAEEFLGMGLVAVLADAGGGKTQLAAQLTAPQENRPAGILLYGRDLHRRQSLDDLAHRFSISGSALTTMEQLLASLDAAGKRAGCRLPLIIDGLNEAENPKDWKAPLAILNKTIERYPNILVVCTLRTGEHRREDQRWSSRSQTTARESFAVMALPDGIRKIESEGFGGDVDEAVAKYFNHFKINPGEAEIPREFLQHPLNLRIFCEVTNPKRKSEVKVDYFPASLSPLFERYVANACERISELINLSYSYTVDDLKLAIYHLGLELWKEKKREIAEADYKTALADTVFQWNKWDSNIINLFTQEGIIFRNPGTEPGHYTITPVYDALGGYLVANSLLVKHANDRILQWLKEPEFITSFEGVDSHELAFDIFRSLVTLIPRRRFGSQLWKEINEPFKNAALRFATELEAEYIDEDTLAALLILMKDNPKERTRLFSQLQRTRGTANHPLNSDFLDKALRALSVSERDLSWTEWIRNNWSERFHDLLAIENRWKNDLTKRTASDQLQAKWVMWLLTSTSLELRDVATRALYWFGRGDAEALFEQSLRSLEVDDPYIPERMLAASYGVVMARHVDLEDNTFVKTTLPKFARNLYDSMLAKDAPFSTTHLLTREYATKIVELAIEYNSNLFSRQEIKRSKPPFTDGGIRDWGESETFGKERYNRDSPLHMDFENYTLGRLVKERRNYDYEHTEYQKVRSRVLWRIEQLGWTSELFKNVENSIANANERYWSRTGREAKKTERYGKKYSWIAYFELLGYLYDSGKIDLTDFGGRDYDMDIDPSFPNDPLDYSLVTDDLLGDSSMSTQDWIENSDVADITKYLVTSDVANQDGGWVLLDGYINQEDPDRNRNRFTFIRTLLVKNQDAPEIIQRLENQDMGNRWLPEIPEMCGYLYAGEIPWSNTFPENEWEELEFVIGKEIKQIPKEELTLLKDNSPISDEEVAEFFEEITEILAEQDEEALGSALEKHGLTPVLQTVFREEEIEEIEKYEVLIPVHHFSCMYQQTFESGGSCTILAKQLCNQLNLIGQPQTFDLFSRDGQRATISLQKRDESEEIEKNAQHFLYIRKELLDQCLLNEDFELVWIIWGERQYSISTMANLAPAYKSGEKKPWEVFQSVITYER